MGAWRASMNGKAGAVHRPRGGSARAGTARAGRHGKERLRSAAERADRLSHQPTREEFSEPEGVEGVEHDQVEIARQPTMLEPVVENDQLRLQLDGGDGRELDPVGVLKVGNVGEVLLQDQALVVDSTCVAVTPADSG